MFERTKDLRLSLIKQMELRATKYPDVISLAQGIPSFDTPQFIKDKVAEALTNPLVAKYSLSAGLPQLRKLIQTKLAEENMTYDWEKEIIVTVGAIQAVTAAMLALTMPGDEVMIPEPAYTSYREVITLAGCKPVYVPMSEEKDWAFEIEKYEEAITPKTKVILFSNPNNPTGTVFSRDQLMGLADLARKHNLYILSEELYKDFVFDEEDKPEGRLFSLAEVPEIRDRVIRIFSFSKTYAMTGWRVGYMHSDAKVMGEILKVHDCMVTCVSVIAQFAAMAALEGDGSNVREFNQKFIERRDLICQRLDKLSKYFSYVRPKGAYYIMPKIKAEAFPKAKKTAGINGTEVVDSWEFCIDLLDKAHVATVPGFAFGPSGEGHFRLNIGRSEENINDSFDRIEKYCAECGG